MMKLNQKIIPMILLILAFLTSPFALKEAQGFLPSDLLKFSEHQSSQKTLTLSLSNYYNLQYSGKISIGSSNEPLDLIFDTGFPWIWVSPENVNPNQVNPACNPPTCNWFEGFQKDEFTFLSRSETVKGYLVTDVMSLQDGEGLKVNQMLLLSKPSEFIPTLYADGFCGLSVKNGHSTPTLLDSLHTNNIVNKRIFGLYLSDNPEAFNETTSEITFGGINPNYEKAEFIHIHILDSQYWQINLNDLHLSTGNVPSTKVELKAKTAIIASGINNIIMSKQDFGSFYNVLRSTFKLDCSLFNKELTCACSDGYISQFPDISFKFDDKTLTIPPSLYLEIKENNCVVLIEGFLESSNEYFAQESEINTSHNSKQKSESTSSSSLNSISSELQDGSYIILGGVFLRNFYTIFDAENKVVSFTKAIRPQRSMITALEVIYLIFGSFILVMFIVFVGCFIQICLTKKTPPEKSNLEKNLIEKKATLSQFVQGLETN